MLKDLEKELLELSALGRVAAKHTVSARKNGFIEIDNKRLVDFTNWDILALNENQRFKRAAQTEIERYGVGTAAPRLTSGTTKVHRSAEKRIATFTGSEDALLFSSRNQAVVTLLSALMSEADAVLVDEYSQTPAVDAASLVHAPVFTFRPDNLTSLKQALENIKNYRRKVVFVESISPLTAKKNDLEQIASLSVNNDSYLITDESFALGAVGLRGAGQIEEPGIKNQVFVSIGDLSFGLAAYGAYVSGPAVVIDYLRTRSKTYQSEAAIPSSIAAAIEASINTAELSTGSRERLALLAKKLQLGLQELGLDIGANADVPFSCIKVKNTNIANELAGALYSKGYLVEVIPAPFPRSQKAVVRMILSASHTDVIVDEFLSNLSSIWSKLKDS